MSSEEKEFKLALPKDKPHDIFDFAELGLELNRGQAIIRQKWNQFVVWRNSEEENVNTFLAKNMRELDELIAQAFKAGVVNDDKKLFKFLLMRYSKNGAMAKMVQIDAVMDGFRQYLNESANNGKKEKENNGSSIKS